MERYGGRNYQIVPFSHPSANVLADHRNPCGIYFHIRLAGTICQTWETRGFILRYTHVAGSDYQNFYLTSVFPQSMLSHVRSFSLPFLITSLSQTPHCYISARFSSVHSATFVGNTTEATCRLLRIPFRFDSNERNPKSTQLYPLPDPKYAFSFYSVLSVSVHSELLDRVLFCRRY